MPTSPNCLTVNRRSATAIAAVRSGISVCLDTVYEIAPAPDPWLLPPITSHGALLLAVQLHSAGAVTVNVPEPPSLVKSALTGDSS
jgi:hypothetical protein